MDWQQLLVETIDLRSFSNLWFWMALVVMWSWKTHWVMGVPFDMVSRVREGRAQAETDLNAIVYIQVNRLLRMQGNPALLGLGAACFGLTVLGLLGFGYGLEIAQALFLLCFPLGVVTLLTMRAAERIAQSGESGEALCIRLAMLRRRVQAIAVLSIFATALWGTYVTLSAAVLGV